MSGSHVPSLRQETTFCMKGKLRRMQQCPRNRWFGVNDRNKDNDTTEKTRLSDESERVAKCKRQLAKMIDLYENNKRAVPTTITNKEIDIIAKERDEIKDVWKRSRPTQMTTMHYCFTTTNTHTSRNGSSGSTSSFSSITTLNSLATLSFLFQSWFFLWFL